MGRDLLNFWEKYELVSSTKSYIPSKIKSKTCRYCDRTDKETTFTQDTHLLPELIGENDILTFDECDICNNLFSDYESNFSIFIRPYITLLGIKGKKKIPAFQSRTIERNEETRTTFKHRQENQKELHIQRIDDYSINTVDKTFEVLFRKPPFVPLKVYKSLLKIGLSLLPTKFDKYNKEAFKWLTKREENLNFIRLSFITTLKRSYFEKPSADLYRAKKLLKGKQEFPEHILILCFANQVIQIFLPFSDELRKVHNGKHNIELMLFPAFAFDNIKSPQTYEIKTYDLGVSNPIVEDHKVSFSYGSAEINFPSQQHQ